MNNLNIHTIIHSRLYIAILFATFLTAGCNHGLSDRNMGQETVIYTDDYGTTVEIPAHPTRIVSTSPAVTEIIFALGGDSLLVGRTDFCTYPAEVSGVESIGGISNLNIEKIMSLKPDLVISGSMIPKKSTIQMAKMGVPTVCVIEQKHYEGLYDNISKIGQLIGCSAAADSLNDLLRSQLADLDIISHSDQPKTVYYVVGFGASGNFTAGGDSFINDIIKMAGGRNIAEDVSGWSYSLETLMSQNPDYIVIRQEDSATFCGMTPYNQLQAVKKGHVIGIESGLIDVQVPRNTEAIQFLAKRLR